MHRPFWSFLRETGHPPTLTAVGNWELPLKSGHCPPACLHFISAGNTGEGGVLLCSCLCLDNRALCDVPQKLLKNREALACSPQMSEWRPSQKGGVTARTLAQPQEWWGRPHCALSPKADLGAPRVLFIVVQKQEWRRLKCFFPDHNSAHRSCRKYGLSSPASSSGMNFKTFSSTPRHMCLSFYFCCPRPSHLYNRSREVQRGWWP